MAEVQIWTCDKNMNKFNKIWFGQNMQWDLSLKENVKDNIAALMLHIMQFGQ